MVEGARELRAAVKAKGGRRPKIEVMPASKTISACEAVGPTLVLTSPPYPGVHVLYHRWQVDGRKETPQPFMIANRPDGAGNSYYTMGDRKYPELRTYFASVRATMSSAAASA
jgi:hypothetical protein